MSNTIIIKNGQSPPSAGTLQRGEMGFDFLNKKLYIGISKEEIFCFNADINPEELYFDVEWIVGESSSFVGSAYVGSSYVA